MYIIRVYDLLEDKKKVGSFFSRISQKTPCNVRSIYIILLSYISHIGAHRTLAIEQQSFELSTASEQEHTITSVLMQSVILPCKAILLIMEPERVKYKSSN
jgi:hypothetical protein